ncbi:MAG: spore germination protein [Peptococcaceae bacterium]|nr:spore germination protein [Peptococcaceae bacterium]
MKDRGKFGQAEAVVMLTMSGMARIFLPFPRHLAETAGEAAWISSLAGLALAMGQVYLLHLVLKPYPEGNIVDVTTGALGRVAGTAACLIYVSFFIAVAAVFTRTFSEALLVTALPRTPISVVSTGYVAMALLGAYMGLEAMARSARVTYPFVVAGMGILLFSLVPLWDFTGIFPLLGTGPAGVFVKGGILAGGMTEILLAAVIVQSFHGPGAFGRVVSRAMLMSFAYLALLELILLMTDSADVAREYTLPFYSLSRLIHLGRYFQRIESIFIIIWGYIGMVKIVLALYAAASVFAGAFRLPDQRPLIWPLALIIFTASLLPPDLPTTVKIESVYIRHLAWLPAVFLPAAVLAADRIRARRRKNEGS